MTPGNQSELGSFAEFTPDFFINAVEDALERNLTGFASSLPSYINRVYELEAVDGTRLIAKFYRPGRWTEEALREEHEFVLDCAAAEIPVIAPTRLPSDDTLAAAGGVFFAVYPKRWGREFEISDDEGWLRLGALLGRIHVAGAAKTASARVRLSPRTSLRKDLEFLSENGFVTPTLRRDFDSVTEEIFAMCDELDFDSDVIRLHGDCHRANLLHRPDEGLMIIDFDDMLIGPPVQDMWLLLPEHLNQSRGELDLILRGYERFRFFDDASIKLIEPLRAMRLIYFLAWCARQSNDHQFQNHFPGWGSDAYWRREVNDLRNQLEIMRHSV